MTITFRNLTRAMIPYRLAWWRNPRVRKFLNDIPTRTNSKTEERWFKRYEKDKDRKFFTIMADDLPVGLVGLTDIDQVNRSASVFIMIGDNMFENRGIGRKALQFIVEYGFRKLSLHKIKLGVSEKNIQAIRCYKAAGFIKEAILRDEFFDGGKYHDELIMTILNQEN